MSSLVLELRSGETLMINGAVIVFREKTKIELIARARFLFGKQIMPPERAYTPARRLYVALQSAYVGTAEERTRGLNTARTLTAALKAVTACALSRERLDHALAAAEAEDGYAALKLARLVVQSEGAELNRDRASGNTSC